MTGPWAQTRRRRISTFLLSWLIGLFWAVAWAEPATHESFEVGQRWEYRHEGPRPGDMEPNVIDGQRILHVVSMADEPEGKQWVIEERFTNSQNVVGRFRVNSEMMLVLLEIENKKGEVAKLRYDPPVPYRALDLAVGEKRRIETTLKMDAAEFSLPSTMTIERLDDATITTPAGEFVGCRHYRTTTASTVNLKIAKIPITEEREQWYHGRVHSLVQEVYRRGPVKFLTWSRAGYTATSVLTAFGTEAVKPALASPAAAAANGPRAGEPGRPPSAPSPRAGPRWLLLTGVAALAAGSLVWARRTRRP